MLNLLTIVTTIIVYIIAYNRQWTGNWRNVENEGAI